MAIKGLPLQSTEWKRLVTFSGKWMTLGIRWGIKVRPRGHFSQLFQLRTDAVGMQNSVTQFLHENIMNFLEKKGKIWTFLCSCIYIPAATGIGCPCMCAACPVTLYWDDGRNSGKTEQEAACVGFLNPRKEAESHPSHPHLTFLLGKTALLRRYKLA